MDLKNFQILVLDLEDHVKLSRGQIWTAVIVHDF